MYIKMNFWCLLKTQYNFKDSLQPGHCKGSFHHVEHQACSSRTCLNEKVIPLTNIMYKISQRSELRMPILILIVEDGAQIAGILPAPRRFLYGSYTEQTKRPCLRFSKCHLEM